MNQYLYVSEDISPVLQLISDSFKQLSIMIMQTYNKLMIQVHIFFVFCMNICTWVVFFFTRISFFAVCLISGNKLIVLPTNIAPSHNAISSLCNRWYGIVTTSLFIYVHTADFAPPLIIFTSLKLISGNNSLMCLMEYTNSYA